jgi:4-amino-4-deoxy-L-arabinose transferase-like glycosyltransferase
MLHGRVDAGAFASTTKLPTLRSKVLLGFLSFAILVTAIVTQRPKTLSDFDQSFYLTIAYDLDRHGVFSNGVFDNVDSTREAPPPGMFFVPGYPLVVLAAMKLDARFAKAAECTVTAVNQQREASDCEPYATPVRVIHAALLALGVVAIALAASLIFPSMRVFWITGALATAGLTAEAFIFSYVMTESLTFFLYSITMLPAVLAWKSGDTKWWGLTGVCLGLLCLTRPSFVVLIPGLLLLIAAGSRFLKTKQSAWKSAAVFVTAVALTIGPWILRNHFSVGKWGLTEEYGSAVLIERFAYNDMTAMEFVTAFPYCTPGLGDLLFDQLYGRDSMHRFVYHTRDSFFHVGRGRRDMLVKEHGRLDPLIGNIVREEMRTDWWRHLLVSIPLAWCGLWVGWIVGLVVVPLFAWGAVRAFRKREPVLLLYAAPAIMMLGLHGALANHYTRYNLILLGPLAVGAAWMISQWLQRKRWPSQVAASES